MRDSMKQTRLPKEVLLPDSERRDIEVQRVIVLSS